VDLELSGDKGSLSLKWVAAGDAGMLAIKSARLKVEGGDITSVAGGLVQVQTAAGSVAIPLPELDAQNGVSVPTNRPAITGSEVIAPYSIGDSGAIVPNTTTGPGLIYSTYLGGSQYDVVNSVAIDSFGACYITGDTQSAGLPTTPGVVQPGKQGSRDAFAAKLNPAGTSFEYLTYLGGTASEYSMAIDVEGGSAYVSGFTGSNNFPTTPSAYSSNLRGPGDIFLAKLNPTGTALDYSTYFGGSRSDAGNGRLGMALSGDGTVCVTTDTDSTDLPLSSNAYQTSHTANFAAAVIKLSTVVTGTDCLLYSTYLCGSGYSMGCSAAVDGDGNIYVAGGAESGGFPTTSGCYANTNKGDYDAFLTKIDPDSATGNGSLLYSTYLGGSSTELASGIAVDDTGNAYLAGRTNSTDFPTANGYDESYNGNGDVFVVKINPAGNQAADLVYGTYVGGSDSSEQGAGIAVDGSGSAYVTGYTSISDLSGDNFPVTPGAFDTTSKAGQDAFAFRLSPSGSNLLYSTYLGGTAPEQGNSIAIDSEDAMYVAGQTESSGFPTTAGAPFSTFQGFMDGFITKLVEEEQPQEPGILTPAAAEAVPSGSLYSVKWVGPEGAKTFKLKYSKDNGLTWTLIVKDITDTNYLWSVPTPLGNKTTCRLKVQSFNEAGAPLPVLASKSPFTIEVVRLTAPQGPGLTLTAKIVAAVTWTHNATAGKIKKLKLTWSKDGGVTWLPITGGTITNTADIESGTFNWTVPTLGPNPKTKCRVMVKLLGPMDVLLGKDMSDSNFTINFGK
jgi:Beta-propeller repeat